MRIALVYYLEDVPLPEGDACIGARVQLILVRVVVKVGSHLHLIIEENNNNYYIYSAYSVL